MLLLRFVASHSTMSSVLALSGNLPVYLENCFSTRIRSSIVRELSDCAIIDMRHCCNIRSIPDIHKGLSGFKSILFRFEVSAELTVGKSIV